MPLEDPALKRSTKRRTKSKVFRRSSTRRAINPTAINSTMIKPLKIWIKLRIMPKRAVLC
jgi:hypothetical protein